MVAVAQLVEHLVVVQDVAGSSPVGHPKVGPSGSRRAATEAARVASVENLRFEPLNSWAIAPPAAICRSLGSVLIKRLFPREGSQLRHIWDVNVVTLGRR